MVAISGLLSGREYFTKIKSYKNVICYGAGSKGAQTVEILKAYDIVPTLFVDRNRDKWGGYAQVFRLSVMKR